MHRSTALKRFQPASETADKVSQALALADRDFFVLPLWGVSDGACLCKLSSACDSPGKHPRVLGWESAATTDPEQIAEWFTRWPHSNIAIAAGPSRLVVLDVDGPGGRRSMDALVSTFGPAIVATTTVVTSRGLHLYYRRPLGVDVPTSKASDSPVFGAGIDVRSVGGYVVAPGSTHCSGHIYAFQPGDEDPDIEPTVLPEELVRLRKKYLETVRSSEIRPILDPINHRMLRRGDTEDGASLKQKKKRAKSEIIWIDPRPELLAIANQAEESPNDDGGSEIAPWVVRWTKTPGNRAAKKNGRSGSQVLFGELLAVARDFFRVDGPNGMRSFFTAVQMKRKASPDLDTRGENPLSERVAMNAWKAAVRVPFTAMPIPGLKELAARKKSNVGPCRLYAFLFLESLRLGVSVSHFAKAERTIAQRLGVSRDTVRHWITRAAEMQLLSVKKGQSWSPGVKRKSSTFALATAGAVPFTASLRVVPDLPSVLPIDADFLVGLADAS